MRRSEKKATHPDVTENVLKAEVGYLGFVTAEGLPRVAPLDFVADGTTVYFHGATAGEKYEALRGSPKVCFSVSVPYSVIPSYWLAAENARGATHYYESVQIDGAVTLIEDPHEKAVALQLLMLKYQSEGQFRLITADDPFYRTTLEETAVFRIDAEHVETRVNLGQSHSVRVRMQLIEKLEERGTRTDLRTAAAMRAMLPSDPGSEGTS